MRRMLFLLIVPFALSADAGVVQSSDDPELRAAMHQAIEAGRSASPDMYLAGVVESISEPRCDGEGNARRCTFEANVIEALASKIVGEGETLWLTGEIPEGTRVLGFFVPEKGGAVWSATYRVVDPGESARAEFEKALKMAGL